MRTSSIHFAFDSMGILLQAGTGRQASPAKKLLESLQNVIQHLRRKTRVHANEERVAHDGIGLSQAAMDALLDIEKSGLAHNVSAEKQARFNARVLEMPHQPCAPQSGPHGDGETEWGGVGARVRPGQNQAVFMRFETLVQALEIPAPGLNESVQLLQLRQPDGGLQVRHLGSEEHTS